MWNQDLYQQTVRFATEAHKGQIVPGTDLPYLLHLSNVCMEVMAALFHESKGIDANLCIQCALLHDTIEDTAVTYQQLKERFSEQVAEGVAALTKNNALPKTESMRDSLERINAIGREIGMVKLADRITNLQAPPVHWSVEKMKAYQSEARSIHAALKTFHKYLADRLAIKIEAYNSFIVAQ
ncbi:MAG: HD domain-containing protein [Bacteroidota bacterium]